MNSFVVRVSNIENKLALLENKLHNVTNSVNEMKTTRDELKTELDSRLVRLEGNVRNLSNDLTDVKEMIDAFGSEGPSTISVEGAISPLTVTSQAAGPKASDGEPRFTYTETGEVLVSTGAGVKEWLEDRGYSIVGTMQKDAGSNEVFFKVKRQAVV